MLLAAAAELPDPTPSARGPWREQTGTGVVLSAPHEVTHVRDGRPKQSERGTGALAFAIARLLGGAAICAAPDQQGDPSWDLGHPYCERAQALSAGAPVIDLHMMRPRGVDVCLGLGPESRMTTWLWQPVIAEAVDAGLRCAVNWPFGATEVTVTGQLQAAGVPAIQIELTFDCFDKASPTMTAAWTALARAARTIVKVGERSS
jgi:hypothetical protein